MSRSIRFMHPPQAPCVTNQNAPMLTCRSPNKPIVPLRPDRVTV